MSRRFIRDEAEALARVLNLECEAPDDQCERCARIRWRIVEALVTFDGVRELDGGFLVPEFRTA